MAQQGELDAQDNNSRDWLVQVILFSKNEVGGLLSNLIARKMPRTLKNACTLEQSIATYKADTN